MEKSNIRKKVYIFAGIPYGDPEEFRKMNIRPLDLPRGILWVQLKSLIALAAMGIIEEKAEPGKQGWHLSGLDLC